MAAYLHILELHLSRNFRCLLITNVAIINPEGRKTGVEVLFSVSIITGKETEELLKVVNRERETAPKDTGANIFTYHPHLFTEQAFRGDRTDCQLTKWACMLRTFFQTP